MTNEKTGDKAGEKAEGKSQTDAAGKQAHDLAKEALEDQVVPGHPSVENADAARVDSMDRVDKFVGDQRGSVGQSRQPRERQDWHEGKTFTALHPIDRSGSPIYPGEQVDFEPGEGVHVSDLLQLKVIAEGAPDSEEVKEALGQADLARGRALAASGF